MLFRSTHTTHTRTQAFLPDLSPNILNKATGHIPKARERKRKSQRDEDKMESKETHLRRLGSAEVISVCVHAYVNDLVNSLFN